ncbi:MAG: hypothetical protein J0I40_09460 [Cellulomonas sp.]|uniref:DUF6602 domain-containing protein n=1 Tax=Cellulomonas sp. 73-92 TaxID=1895740 RepID=UPI00092A87F2|nr:DUF6602 domain-containing protein [Cellulomonas sp. 73-92]MBN9375599.1 hypothetical protein [Cellulomonas sp.]OJV78690.1 MAG: hypothetical protein BGO37_12685 [Cellulomonas sp. 73-92]
MVRFQGILATHERELAAAYERSAAAATHSTTRGGQREEALRDFLREHLPKRYAVAQGHAIDSAGTESPQLDIVIYDSMSAAPLSQDAGIVTLAAEALLAVVEVKSTLDGAELEKIARSLRTLYRLRPFGAGWGSPILGGRPSGGLPQLYYSVFAYETAFGKANWPGGESQAWIAACREAKSPAYELDSLLVLSRGLYVPLSGKALPTRTSDGRHLAQWYFGLLNFLVRESQRRLPTPWKDYQLQHDGQWERDLTWRVSSPQRDQRAPLSRTQRGRQRRLNNMRANG